jgi:hypothetical protein
MAREPSADADEGHIRGSGRNAATLLDAKMTATGTVLGPRPHFGQTTGHGRKNSFCVRAIVGWN